MEALGWGRAWARRYLLVETDGAAPQVTAVMDDDPAAVVPLSWTPLVVQGTGRWIVSIPDLQGPVTITVGAGDETLTVVTGTPASDAKAPGRRGLFRRKARSGKEPAPAAPVDWESVARLDNRARAGRPAFEVLGVFPLGDRAVMRVRVSAPAQNEPQAPVMVDRRGHGVDLAWEPMEDTDATDEKGRAVRHCTWSCALPRDWDWGVLWVAGEPGGFMVVDAPLVSGELDRFRGYSAAPGAQGDYGEWLQGALAGHGVGTALPAGTVERRPVTAVVVGDGNPAPTLWSLDSQSYPVEKILVQGVDGAGLQNLLEKTGESMVCLVEAGSELVPWAVESLVRLAEAHPEDGVFYGDSDVHDGGGFHDPAIRWAFSPEELLAGDCLGPVLLCRATVDLSGARSRYGAALGAWAHGTGFRHGDGVIAHVPRLVSAAHGTVAQELRDRLGEMGMAAEVTVDPSGWLRVAPALPEALVSIIIPSHDRPEYLRACVESIYQKTTWPSFEVVVVENGSHDPELFSLYDQLQEAHGNLRVITLEVDGFNYSRVVNEGARAAEGDYLLFLNNDTEVLEGPWIEALLAPFVFGGVGVTGALLTYPDGLVQHGGMVCLPDGGYGILNHNLDPSQEGYRGSLVRPFSCSVVMGACQMVDRGTWEAVGGYDETLAVAMNDGDFCMEAAERGLRTVFTPHARLMHREFGTRIRETDDHRELVRWFRERSLADGAHPGFFAGHDPFYNGLYEPTSRYFQLRED